MQESTNHCIIYDGGGVHDHQPLHEGALWLRQFLEDVGCVREEPTSIMCDNQGCIALAKNPAHHSRTKHIDVQHHIIRQKLENQDKCLKNCPTKDITLDMLTKPLVKVSTNPLITRKVGVGASTVQWTTIDPCSGLSDPKLYTNFEFYEIKFHKHLENI